MPRNKNKAMRILLVDDDVESRLSINACLDADGHEVFVVENGHDVIAVFTKFMPDLVLIDTMVSGVSSSEVAVFVKKNSGSRLVHVIFLTNYSDNETIAECISGGADDFIAKPVNQVILNFKLQSFQRIHAMYHKLDKYQRETEEELETSMHIFNSLIDDVNHDVSNLFFWAESFGHFSGDTRLFKTLKNGHVHVLLCDFTGHGLPAAIGTVFVADLFRSMTNKLFDAREILNEINEKMNQILPTGRYCAAIMLDYFPEKKSLKIWNCGLPSAFLIDEHHKIRQEFPSVSVPLGVLKGDAPCEGVEISVTNTSAIILYSDGITEAENPDGVMYSESRLQVCIESTKKDAEIGKEIQQNVEDFMGGTRPTDDISLVVLNFNPVSTRDL